MEIEKPEPIEICRNPDHWTDIIAFGHCMRCNHVFSLSDKPLEIEIEDEVNRKLDDEELKLEWSLGN